MRKASIATAILSLSLSCACVAQQGACGLSKMTETTPAFYPPIGKAAHVEGDVILLVTFKISGEVEQIETIKAPKILESPARTYVQGWRANEYSGPRTCPIVIHYRLIQRDDRTTPTAVRKDLQHVTINAPLPPPLDSASYTVQASKQSFDCRFSDPSRVQQLYYEIPDHCDR